MSINTKEKENLYPIALKDFEQQMLSLLNKTFVEPFYEQYQKD